MSQVGVKKDDMNLKLNDIKKCGASLISRLDLRSTYKRLGYGLKSCCGNKL